jgi:hypothetical protein
MTLTLSGVAMQALLPATLRYSYIVFLAGSLVWVVNGLSTRNRALVLTHTVLIVLNSIAVIHWFT